MGDADQETPKATQVVIEDKRRTRSRSLFWPGLLIAAGVLLLLWNLGYVPDSTWNVLWRLWPVLLIALGIELLIGRRGKFGAVLSGLLILLLLGIVIATVLLVPYVPEWSGLSASPQGREPTTLAWPAEWRTGWRAEHITYPLEGAERASIVVDWGGVPGYASALNDSASLLEGDVDYRGQLNLGAGMHNDRAEVQLDTSSVLPWLPSFALEGSEDRRWDVRLSPQIPLALSFYASSSPLDLDLSEIQVVDLYLDVGSGAVALYLPGQGTYKAEIDGGSGPLTVHLPESVAAQVWLEAGSGPVVLGERFHLVQGAEGDDGVWETENWETAEDRVEFEIDQGVGSIRFR
jgi:hypothetical protein